MNADTLTPELIHNTDIPGWANKDILNVLGKYASLVPENGVILEIGGLFGRSTFTLGKNKKDSVKLMTIDVWPTMLYHNFHDQTCGAAEQEMINSRMKGDPLLISGEDFYDLWSIFTKDVVNLEGIKGRSIMPHDEFPMIDFLYHDAGHSFDDVFADLTHWLPKLKQDAIIIVDDYDIVTFPGVIGAVDLFAKINNLQTTMVTNRNILLRR